MIGVIVWSSAAKLKAVIWCEDQGALAYLHGTDKLLDGQNWPEAGDMVALETEMRDNLRHAFKVRIIDEKRFTQLPGILREMGQSTPPEDRMSNRWTEPMLSGSEMAGSGSADLASAEQGDAASARPALRLVSSQEAPQVALHHDDLGHPPLVAVMSGGKSG